MLRITIHDSPGSLRFQLEGRLAGPWASEVDACWRKALADGRRGTLRVDLTAVTFVDTVGKQFLADAHAQGAEFIAADCLMKAVVAEVTGKDSSRHRQRPAGSGI